MTDTSCVDCGRGHDHCHGILLVHADGTTECELECDGDPDTHEHAVECDEPCCR